ncbi:glycosyltransferase [Danxiaibacter flavus]|uniref:Glycosyltransferase n=1 Tax=Danxiaibacter flavus TaxID=3049108 RepID=A0ABV3ZIE2_9BACT|nr:glycosyltransferase [Chitinophagaceae bacterium DXS]
MSIEQGMNNNNPLVSVITPFLNGEKFLAETVESVLRQTYTHWELFLVDDGSTDGSTQMAKSYAASYPDKIFYLEHKDHANLGVCASRNMAIEQSKGELIAPLDSDDVWYPEKLQTQVEIFRHYPEAGMTSCAYEYWYSWNNNATKKDVIVPVGGPQNIVVSPPVMLTYLYPLSDGDAPSPSGIMIRRFVYEKYARFEAGVFVGDYQFYEDQAFFCKIYFNTPVFISPKCHVRYRQSSGSLVAVAYKEGKYYDARRFFLVWLKDYMKTQGIKNKEVARAYRRAWAPYSNILVRAYYEMKGWAYKFSYPVLKLIRKKDQLHNSGNAKMNETMKATF